MGQEQEQGDMGASWGTVSKGHHGGTVSKGARGIVSKSISYR